MKKFFILAVITSVAFACHRKTAVQSTPAPTAEEVAHAELLKQGATIYTTKCTRCHGAKPVANYNTDQWTRILKGMIPKAKLTDAEAEQVTAYVMANAKK